MKTSPLFILFIYFTAACGQENLKEKTTENSLDDIEVARRLFGLNLDLNFGGLNPLSSSPSKQGIYTSVPAPQRKEIESGCRTMMSGIASINAHTRVNPDSPTSTDIPPLSRRRWSLFNMLGNDPYMTVMNDCTQILAIVGSPSMNIPGPSVRPAAK